MSVTTVVIFPPFRLICGRNYTNSGQNDCPQLRYIRSSIEDKLRYTRH